MFILYPPGGARRLAPDGDRRRPRPRGSVRGPRTAKHQSAPYSAHAHAHAHAHARAHAHAHTHTHKHTHTHTHTHWQSKFLTFNLENWARLSGFEVPKGVCEVDASHESGICDPHFDTSSLVSLESVGTDCAHARGPLIACGSQGALVTQRSLSEWLAGRPPSQRNGFRIISDSSMWLKR